MCRVKVSFREKLRIHTLHWYIFLPIVVVAIFYLLSCKNTLILILLPKQNAFVGDYFQNKLDRQSYHLAIVTTMQN